MARKLSRSPPIDNTWAGEYDGEYTLQDIAPTIMATTGHKIKIKNRGTEISLNGGTFIPLTMTKNELSREYKLTFEGSDLFDDFSLSRAPMYELIRVTKGSEIANFHMPVANSL